MPVPTGLRGARGRSRPPRAPAELERAGVARRGPARPRSSCADAAGGARQPPPTLGAAGALPPAPSRSPPRASRPRRARPAPARGPRRRGVRRLRRLGARRGRRQAHLLRPLRAAAPRPGGRRHRGSATAATSSSTRTSAWSRRSSTSPPWRACAGHLAIGHTPLLARPARAPGRTRSRRSAPSTTGGSLALGHNGNLTNTSELARAASRDLAHRRDGRDDRLRPHHHAARRPARTVSLEDAALRGAAARCEGAFCLVFMDEHTLYAARDPHGVRPLVLGRLERGWVVASETAALDIVGAIVRPRGRAGRAARDRRARRAQPALRARRRPRAACSSTSTWPAPTPRSPAARVNTTRVAGRPHAGLRGARPTPTSSSRCRSPARPAAIGYAEQSGIPYGQGLVKNAYVGRTFIQPSQTIRQLGIRLKLNPLREVIARQAPGRRRRLDRARQHPARAGPDAARGRRRRGARAHLRARR